MNRIANTLRSPFQRASLRIGFSLMACTVIASLPACTRTSEPDFPQLSKQGRIASVRGPGQGGYTDKCECVIETSIADHTRSSKFALDALAAVETALKAKGFDVQRLNDTTLQATKFHKDFGTVACPEDDEFSVSLTIEPAGYQTAYPALKTTLQVSSRFASHIGKHPDSGVASNNWDAESLRRTILDTIRTSAQSKN